MTKISRSHFGTTEVSVDSEVQLRNTGGSEKVLLWQLIHSATGPSLLELTETAIKKEDLHKLDTQALQQKFFLLGKSNPRQN